MNDRCTRWPSVSVVIPSHCRPAMLRRALASVLNQDYAGDIEVIVVYDRAESDPTLVSQAPGRTVRVCSNSRTPGLAGARNTGILAARGTLVAFCDDDDSWRPEKLLAQVARLADDPGCEFVTTAMTVDFEGKRTDRLARRDQVVYRDLLRSRMAMLHSSSFLMRRDAVLQGIGLVEESLPRSMDEDWELLLRASRRHPIAHVDRPLVEVTWGASSYFADQWKQRNEARMWLLQRYPDFTTDAKATGLSYGKLAFGHAALGQRRQALSCARRAFRANWREPRTFLALLVASRLVRWQFVMRTLNQRGHGI